jgi:isoquinoline 1-oxidoreductase beta subunit
LQGAIIFGLGNALLERITFRNGVPQQSNFHDYSLMRMADVPRIHIEIMPSSAQPTAVGQTGAVLVAPAIANAFARLTGKRLRHMPFLDTRVLNALNG